MSEVLELSQAGLALNPESSVARARSYRLHPAVLYSLLVFFLPLLAIPAFIALGRSNFFLHHGASIWVQSNDAIFDMRDRDCDVLVFGDSTAMTGIDPDVVEHDTGLRTCNIAVTNAVLAVTGNLTLDHFLAHNGRPRILILQLSPDDFQPENRMWHHTIYAEGLLELLRHGSPAEGRRVLATHPHEAISFAGYAAGFSAYYAIKDVWFRATHLRPEEDQVRVRNGFFTPPSPPRTYCEHTDKPQSGVDGAFARNVSAAFRRTYADRSDAVLVDVAPIPSCDANLETFTSQLKGITSNDLRGLPIGFFNDDRHYTATGSRLVSTLVARQVQEITAQSPARSSPAEPSSELAGLRRISLQRR